MKKVVVIGDEIKVQKVGDNLQYLSSVSYENGFTHKVTQPIHQFRMFYREGVYGDEYDKREYSRISKYEEFGIVRLGQDVNTLTRTYGYTLDFVVDTESITGEILQYYMNDSDRNSVSELRAEVESLKMTNVGLNTHIRNLKDDKNELKCELEMLETEKEVFRKSYNEISYTPTLKVILSLIKVWFLNKFNW